MPVCVVVAVDGSVVLYTTIEVSDVLIMSSNGVLITSPTKSMLQSIVRYIPNVFSIPDSARAAKRVVPVPPVLIK